MKGSCQCQNIEYSASDDVKAVLNCHCNLCRKMNGSAYSTYVVVPDADFTVSGDSLQRVRLTERASKVFCNKCGTPLFNENPTLGKIKILHLGSIDGSAELKPAVNIYCESQLPWVLNVETLQSLPQGFG